MRAAHSPLVGGAHTLVVIPTYNECANIPPLLKAIFGLELAVQVLIVDDGSPDGTASCVRQLQATYPQTLHLLQRPKKAGIGSAYLAGFLWALSSDCAYVCSMDADLSHAPEDLLKLVAACRLHAADLAVGSRYIRGSLRLHWPRSRSILSHAANAAARWTTGLRLRDLTSGFVCYRRTFLERMLTQKIVSSGYSFQVETKYRSHALGGKIVEVPIVFRNRTQGNSKLNLAKILESGAHLCLLQWGNWFGRRQ